MRVFLPDDCIRDRRIVTVRNRLRAHAIRLARRRAKRLAGFSLDEAPTPRVPIAALTALLPTTPPPPCTISNSIRFSPRPAAPSSPA